VTEAKGNRAVVVLATGEARTLADKLRLEYDTEWFERVPPHVSLVGPCELGEPDDVVAARLAEALADARPFDLRLGAPGAFVTPTLILYLSIDDDSAVRELEARVRRAVPLCSTGLSFTAHLTVGRFASQGALSAALCDVKEELARHGPGAEELGFPVRDVHLFKEDKETGVFSSAARVELAAGG